MLFYRQLRPIAFAEDWARRHMRGFDQLPPATRFALNCAPVWPEKAAVTVARYGDDKAAQTILEKHWSDVFKSRDRTGAHP